MHPAYGCGAGMEPHGPRVPPHGRTVPPVSGFLPLLLALVLAETAWRTTPAAAGSRLAWFLAVGLGGGWLLCEAVVRWLAAWRTRPPRLVERWDLAFQALIIGWFAWLCLGLGWPRRAGGYTIALLPWAVLQVVHWWTLAHASRGRWTRAGHVWYQVRFVLLPLAIALPVVDLFAWFGDATGLERWSVEQIGPVAVVIGSLAIAAGLVLALPWVLIRLWRARPPADPVLAERFAALARAAGVRVAGLLLWPAGGGRFHNAMMIGVLPRLRWVLVTADLAHDFASGELAAVLGHELGHARHRHLWLYLLFACTVGLASWLAASPVADAIGRMPGFDVLPGPVRDAVAAVLLLGLCWRLAFGVLSRLCERQADLAGAELAGGARAMQGALLALARCAGHDPDTPNWRHYTLRQRIAWLERLADDPGEGARHHRRVATAWWLLAGLAAGLLAVAFLHGGDGGSWL